MVHQLCTVTSAGPTRESGQLSFNVLSRSPALDQKTKAWQATREMLLFISLDRLLFFSILIMYLLRKLKLIVDIKIM